MSELPLCNGADVDFDFLSEAFNSDTSFERLLQNRTFSDYFNTFLSLPVFAVRVLYRKDNHKFELDIPVSKTAHHVIEEKVITWVRTNRAPLFLKTPISNEFRLCAQLLELSVCLSVDSYFDKDEIKKFQSKYLTKVIDMQRFKCYLQGTFGEGLVNFWLDAEKFRRQIPDACRRFVLKDINEKYLCPGGISELSFSVRENIKANLKGLWEKKGKVRSTYINADVLVEAQNIVLKSLQDYWIPKYVYHRLKRRGLIKKRWGKVLSLPKVKKVRKKKAQLFQLVNEIRALYKENPSLKSASEVPHPFTTPIIAEEKNLRKLSSGDGGKKPRRSSSKGSAKKDMVDTIRENLLDDRTNASRRQSLKETSWAEKEKTNRRKSRKASGVVSMESLLPIPQHPRRARALSESVRASIHEDDDNSEHLSMWSRITQKHKSIAQVDRYDEGPLELRSPIDDNKLITLEDDTLFKPMFPSIVAEDTGTKKRNFNFYESMHENESDDDTSEDEERTSQKGVSLPLIKTLNETGKSFLASMVKAPRYSIKIQQPYSKTFVKENTLTIVPDEGQIFNLLIGGLTTDQIAGQPLLQYFKDTDKKVAESNLKFWTTCNDILTDSRCDEPMVRQKQYHTLIHLHLSEYSESHLSLPESSRKELCKLLPSDIGVTKLMEAANRICHF